MSSSSRVALISALWLFFVGCQGTSETPLPDAQPGDAEPVDGAEADVMIAADAEADAAIDRGLAADSGPDGEPDPEPDAGADATTGPEACDPPLAIEPAEAFSAAFDLVVLTPTGGTGNHRFELVENNSGAIVNPLSGAYLAGSVEEVDDRVRLTDTACIGDAFATVHVTRPLEIRPSQVAVATRQMLQFDVVGGSGRGEYRLRINNTQSTLTREGGYTAGPRFGRDVVVVRDPGTGLEAEAVVSVVEDPTLAADPPQLFLPLDAEMPVTFVGGSGWFDITREGRTATYDPPTRTFRATSPGRTRFDLQDQYTPQEITIVVDVVEPQQAPLGRAGRGLDTAIFHGPGDLDRDGYPDGILGHPEPSIEAFSDGAVFLYRGGPQGLRAAPVQVINGRAREDQFGRALTTADIDRDGHPDLIVGSWLDDLAGENRGAVYIYPGLPDGTFGDEPLQTLTGVRNGDNFGIALAACDFNGDGLTDLAITASAYENTGAEYAADNQGGVLVFLGSEAGFRLTADGGILPGGTLNAEGIFVGAGGLALGTSLAAGDIDGDGVCDLAAAAPGAGGNNGVIHVFRGRLPDPAGDGGLAAPPNRIYTGANANNLGRALAVADINGDRRADIIATEPGYDAPAAANAGAVRIFSGGPLAGPVRQTTPVTEAQYTWAGRAANQTAGVSLAVADQTGDRIVDLVIGSRFDENPAAGAVVDTGSISVIPGRADDWPAAEPSLVAYGATRGEQFGDTVAVLGDVDGDGETDLGTLASRESSLGINVGRPFFISGADARTRALDLPGAPAGAQNGFSIAAVGDIDRDGLSDLVVGAPATPLPDQLNAGVAYLYRGTETGYAREPTTTFVGHPGHSANDRFGFDITGGDFDGDGIPDVFISAQAEQRDANLPADTYAVDGNCPRAGGQGAVYIYRGGDQPIAPARPDYIFYGPGNNNANLARIAAIDLNDDGRDDLLAGGGGFNGFQVIYGRSPAPDGRIRVLCDPAYTFNTRGANTGIGQSFTLLGDINFDGCNDFAVGAPRETADRSGAGGPVTNQAGTVRVFYGWNNEGCGRERTVVIGGEVANGLFGHSVAAGNVIGGAEIDLVIGAPNTTNDGNVRTGGVFVVDGAYLASLPSEPPDRLQPAIFSVAPAGADRTLLLGTENAESFGRSVTVIGGRVIAGRLAGRVGLRTNIGGAQVYGFHASGLPYRAAAIAGETWRQNSLIGEVLARDRTRPFLAIGGYQASGLATDAGAVYVYNLSGVR